MKFVLLVTWFVTGQPPASYQIEFSGGSDCLNAAAQLHAEADRLNIADHASIATDQEATRQAMKGLAAPILTVPTANKFNLSAVCIRSGSD
jgi:hypothetical protein